MKIVLALDSFKGSATSSQAADWVAAGIRRFLPTAEIIKFPIADGGEGTTTALVQAFSGKIITVPVADPWGETIEAAFGLLDETTAVIEMAQAAGFRSDRHNEEDALIASTYGVGQLILAAITAGATKIYLGLGGSATSDGGVGLAQALGVIFKDATGAPVPAGAKYLAEIATIDISQLDPALENITIQLLSDVDNPLTGEHGAIYVYGPQKGLPPASLAKIDRGMQHYEELLAATFHRPIGNLPGAGAAGGLGAGLVAFTNAQIKPGITTILQLLEIETAIATADLVITGEGSLDSQSLRGKVPVGIAALAKKHQKPVVALVGGHTQDLQPVYAAGIDLVLSIIPRPMTLTEAMAEVKTNLIQAGETTARAFYLGKTKSF